MNPRLPGLTTSGFFCKLKYEYEQSKHKFQCTQTDFKYRHKLRLYSLLKKPLLTENQDIELIFVNQKDNPKQPVIFVV